MFKWSGWVAHRGNCANSKRVADVRISGGKDLWKGVFGNVRNVGLRQGSEENVSVGGRKGNRRWAHNVKVSIYFV